MGLKIMRYREMTWKNLKRTSPISRKFKDHNSKKVTKAKGIARRHQVEV